MKNKFIFIIAIAAGIGGVSEILEVTRNGWFKIIAFFLSPIQISIVNPQFGGNIIANLILGIALLWSAYAYSQNKRNYHTLLFCMLVVFIHGAWSAIQWPVLFVAAGERNDINLPIFLVFEVKFLVYMYFAGKASKLLVKGEKPKGEARQMDTYSYMAYHEAPLFTRVRHRLIDVLILASAFAVPSVFVAAYFGANTSGDSYSWQQITFILLGEIIFYFFTEWIFGTTPGKAITQTRVYDEDGAKATSGQLLKRTFLRLVPLEALSFVVHHNWHDSWSGTRVYELDETEN